MTNGERPTAAIGRDLEAWAREAGEVPGGDLTGERPTAQINQADFEYWIEWLAAKGPA